MLTSQERSAIIKISNHQPPEIRNSILHDLDTLESFVENEDRSIIYFREKCSTGDVVGQQPIAPEGRMFDSDGGVISVIVYIGVNRRIVELELVKEDGGGVISPQWDSLELEHYA